MIRKAGGGTRRGNTRVDMTSSPVSHQLPDAFLLSPVHTASHRHKPTVEISHVFQTLHSQLFLFSAMFVLQGVSSPAPQSSPHTPLKQGAVLPPRVAVLIDSSSLSSHPMEVSVLAFYPSICTSALSARLIHRTLLQRIRIWPRSLVNFWSMYSCAFVSWMLK